MKMLKKIEKHIQEEVVIDTIICDICKEDVRKNSTNWSCDYTKVEGTFGSVYPECDTRDTYIIDVCKDCFMDKLIPVVEKEFDIKFREIMTEERGILKE